MLPYSGSYFEETKCTNLKFAYFPVIKNTFKRIAFENAYESNIIFQSSLFANIPAESTFIVPT